MPQKEKTEWEKKIDDAIDIALKVSQGIPEPYKLIVFEVVLRKMLEIKFP